MDISVGGISTNLKQKYDSKKYSKEDLAYSCQETVFAMLVEVAERAMAHTQKKELVLGGGVACNSRLQEMCKIMCKERKAKYYCPERPVLVDNGLMIAWQGILQQKQATKQLSKIDILPKWRTDEVFVDWK
jgi:tRNA A37 threonylcarbamoyltransferase TsaD